MRNKTQITIVADKITFWTDQVDARTLPDGKRAGDTYTLTQARLEAVLKLAHEAGWVGRIEMTDRGETAFFLAPAGQTPWTWNHLVNSTLQALQPQYSHAYDF